MRSVKLSLIHKLIEEDAELHKTETGDVENEGPVHVSISETLSL